jgi:hypothetical protein
MKTRRLLPARLAHRLDPDTVDRLLGGRMHPDDAPPGYAAAARIIGRLVAPPRPHELVGQHAAADSAVRALSGIRTGSRSERRRPSWARRTGLVAISAALVTTGVAAADVLPEGAADIVSSVWAGTRAVLGIDEDRGAGSGDAGHPATSAGAGSRAVETHPMATRRPGHPVGHGRGGHPVGHGRTDHSHSDGGAHGYPPTVDLPDAANAKHAGRGRSAGGSAPGASTQNAGRRDALTHRPSSLPASAQGARPRQPGPPS